MLNYLDLKALFGVEGLVGKFRGKTDRAYGDIPVYYTVDPYKLQTNPKLVLSMNVDLKLMLKSMFGSEILWDTDQDYKDYKFLKDTGALMAEIVDASTEYVMNGNKLRIAVDLEWRH